MCLNVLNINVCLYVLKICEKILKNPENLNLVSYKIITPGFVYVFCSPKNNCRDMALCLTKTWKQKCYFDYIYIYLTHRPIACPH